MSAPASAILVLDDDRTLLGLVQAVLASHGHRVTVAADGPGAAAALAWEPFDILVADLLFAGPPGIEALIELARRRGPVRVIALSRSTPLPADEQRGLARLLGAEAILSKPFGEAELLAAVAALFSPPPKSRRADKEDSDHGPSFSA